MVEHRKNSEMWMPGCTDFSCFWTNAHKQGKFTASNPDKLIAWYFLDFNEGALKEQQEKHWDGSSEELFEALPHVEN
jgi:hypothetical protein